MFSWNNVLQIFSANIYRNLFYIINNSNLGRIYEKAYINQDINYIILFKKYRNSVKVYYNMPD